MIHADMSCKRLVMVGFGSIGPAVLPLLVRHVRLDAGAITIIASDDANRAVAEEYGATFVHETITPSNYVEVVGSRLRRGDFLLNLSVRVSSLDLISLCHELGALYLDTGNETWPNQSDMLGLNTYERRMRMVSQRPRFSEGPTALICHGANPGLVSHFTKQALMDVSEQMGQQPTEDPTLASHWARLARDLGVIRVHISERDTQVSSMLRLEHEYVNTWSIDGFFAEASEYSHFAWGTHEEDLPRSFFKRDRESEGFRMVELHYPGGAVKMRSWVPRGGAFDGYLISHPEAFSIAQMLSLAAGGGEPAYHPTVHFVYRPCEDAIASMRDAATQKWLINGTKRLLFADVEGGLDELGVLLMRRDSAETYWYGSELDVQEARLLAPHNNATSMQVAAGVFSGLVWVLDNPRRGLVEPEQVDFRRVLEVARGYLGRVQGHWAQWPHSSNWEHVGQRQPTWHFRDLAVSLGEP